MYLREAKHYTTKLFELINTFNEAPYTKISKFLIPYSRNKHTEKETRKIVPFTRASKMPKSKPNYRNERLLQ